jgi:hypothetical protein
MIRVGVTGHRVLTDLDRVVEPRCRAGDVTFERLPMPARID